MGNDFCTMENNCCTTGKDVVTMGNLHRATVNNLCTMGKNLCSMECSFVSITLQNSNPGEHPLYYWAQFLYSWEHFLHNGEHPLESIAIIWARLGSLGMIWDHLDHPGKFWYILDRLDSSGARKGIRQKKCFLG